MEMALLLIFPKNRQHKKIHWTKESSGSLTDIHMNSQYSSHHYRPKMTQTVMPKSKTFWIGSFPDYIIHLFMKLNHIL